MNALRKKMSEQKNKVCRLCYYETVDTTDIFSKDGIAFDYIGKINKYLYFSVSEYDELPKTVCWMCTQQLETFHKFVEKINDIQKCRLTSTKYNRILLQHKLHLNAEILSNVEKPCNTVEREDGSTYEILVITNGFEGKSTPADDEFEEFELVEVDNDEPNIEYPNEKSNLLEHQPNNSLESQQTSEIDIIDVTNIQKNDENESNESKSTDSVKKLKQHIKIEVQCTRKSARQAAKQKKSQYSSNTSKLLKSLVTKRKHDNSITKPTDENVYDECDDEMQQDCDDIAEGDSDNEFPSRDSDNDDWPSQETLDEFPKQIINNGLLLYKGKELMSMICRFYNLECKQCEKKSRFKKLNDLFEHYTNVHNQAGYVECCQTKLLRYPAIIMHMARHLQPDAFKCDECGYIVTRPRFLESHKQTHLPDEQKPFSCEICSRRFCWKSALRIHAISHQPPSERRQYICHVCGRTYDTPGGLSTHKKLAHSGVRPSQSNVCHICAKCFSTRTGLHEHMLTIHQPREKGQLQCNECGKWLMNSRCLKTHMILHSDAEFRCDQCDYVTKKKVLLNRHLLTQHSNERPFICNLCGRDFKMKRSLTVHIAQHGSTTKYQCPFCDRSFNSSTNFYTHRKNLHPKELLEMKRREEEEQRRKRIEAGVEEEESALNVSEIRDTQLILTTDTGEEYTVLEIT